MDGEIIGTVIGFATGALFGGWFGYLIALEAGRGMLNNVLNHTYDRTGMNVPDTIQPEDVPPLPEAIPGCRGCAANECSGWCDCKCHRID